MTTYQLFAESGPRHRKTMVHVPALLGCVAGGATTDEALEATPVAIRAHLAFLARHGVTADPEEPIELDLVGHLTAELGAQRVRSGTRCTPRKVARRIAEHEWGASGRAGSTPGSSPLRPIWTRGAIMPR